MKSEESSLFANDCAATQHSRLQPKTVLWLNVAVDVPLAALPAHMALSDGVDYVWRSDSDRSDSDKSDSNRPEQMTPRRGSVVLVTWANKRCLGVVLSILDAPRYDSSKVLAATMLPALEQHCLPETVLKLAQFASQYYHRAVGQVLLPTVSAALPAPKRPKSAAAIAAAAARMATLRPQALGENPAHTLNVPSANPEQSVVNAALGGSMSFAVHLLYGVTGSGKSEVYFARAAQAIAQGKQVLILVPEIVLVPAMMGRVKKALPYASVVALHSEIAPALRRKNWSACLALPPSEQVHVVVGTRLAVFAPLAQLGLVVVDEEHDPSYKQQEGVRYCARNLAVVRAQLDNCPVVLGSATPSLETWLKARQGKYRSHRLTQRAKSSALPDWVQINLMNHPSETGLSGPAMDALADTLARGEQSLVFLNRRGYAPVLTCTACGWGSECGNCSSHMALHKLRSGWKLVCHHCTAQAQPPKNCPHCGNAQLEPEGQGTQAIEQTLHQTMAHARVARLDSDITQKVGQGKRIAQAMADRELDILVGTQMTAKGHDFPALSTVVVVGCDGALFSPDYRGVERLFALLTQVSGRAGRANLPGTVYLQTRQPAHPLFAALLQPSVDEFYTALLAERQQAGLPPYSYQAVLRASHVNLDTALAWLASAKKALDLTSHPLLRVFSPIPMLMPKVATKFRAQLLFESSSRAALHALLDTAMPLWLAASKALKVADVGYGVVWHLEIDPSEV